MTPQVQNIAENSIEGKRRNNAFMRVAARRAYACEKKQSIGDDLIVEFLPMVRAIVQKVTNYIREPLSFEDLVSSGTIGLVKAARDYDASQQAKFKTYAYIKIKGAVLDELRKFNILPTKVNKQVRETFELSRRIYKTTGREPGDIELAEMLGISVDELYKVYENARTQNFVSMESSNENGGSMADFLACGEASPESGLEKAELTERLTEAITALPQKQRQVILLYYQQHLNMKQVAEVLSITESRVSQLHAAAVFSLSVKLGGMNDGER